MSITITYIRLNSLWKFFRLSWLGYKIMKQAQKQPGFIRMKNTGFGYMHYTLSAWENEAAMKAFAYKPGAHLDAMKESRRLASAIGTYTFQSEKLPDWEEARRLVDEKGRALPF